MRKIIFICAILLCGQAFAKSNQTPLGNYYVGLDVFQSYAKHRVSNVGGLNTILPENSNDFVQRDNQRAGFGVNVGYRFNLGSAYYLAPELFYDKLRSSSHDFYFADETYPSPSDRLKLSERMGVKVNLGYNFSDLAERLQINNVFGRELSKVSFFVNAGVSRLSYRINLVSIGRSDDSYKIAPIYGFGFTYAATPNWSVKFAYDMQNMALRYLDNGLRDSLQLKTLRLGVIYNF